MGWGPEVGLGWQGAYTIYCIWNILDHKVAQLCHSVLMTSAILIYRFCRTSKNIHNSLTIYHGNECAITLLLQLTKGAPMLMSRSWLKLAWKKSSSRCPLNNHGQVTLEVWHMPHTMFCLTSQDKIEHNTLKPLMIKVLIYS